MYSSFANQQSLNPPRESIYRQEPPSTCGVDESLMNLSSSSWKYDHNDNEYSCSCCYWTTPSVTPVPCAYNSRTFINCDTTNYLLSHSIQRQQSTTSDFNLPCIMPAAVSLFQTGTSDGHWNDRRAVSDGANHFVDASPSSFNDSGLGSASFGSATDVDCSSSTDSSFVWTSNYGFCPLQPTEICRDSISVQTV